MHKLYSACKGHYRYLDLDYDMFDVAAIIGYDVTQTKQNSACPAEASEHNAVNNFLNGSFQSSNRFEIIPVRIFFNVA